MIDYESNKGYKVYLVYKKYDSCSLLVSHSSSFFSNEVMAVDASYLFCNQDSFSAF